MWSSETFPVASKAKGSCSSGGNRSVEQAVAPHRAPGRGQVLGQGPTEQLTGASHAAHDPRLGAVGEDRRVALAPALDGGHPVQRVAAEEQLEVAGAEG